MLPQGGIGKAQRLQRACPFWSSKIGVAGEHEGITGTVRLYNTMPAKVRIVIFVPKAKGTFERNNVICFTLSDDQSVMLKSKLARQQRKTRHWVTVARTNQDSGRLCVSPEL